MTGCLWTFVCHGQNILVLLARPVLVHSSALNFEFYVSDWHFSLTLFTAVLISNTTSDGDWTPPILPDGKKSRSTPSFKVYVLLLRIQSVKLMWIIGVMLLLRYVFSCPGPEKNQWYSKLLILIKSLLHLEIGQRNLAS